MLQECVVTFMLMVWYEGNARQQCVSGVVCRVSHLRGVREEDERPERRGGCLVVPLPHNSHLVCGLGLRVEGLGWRF